MKGHETHYWQSKEAHTNIFEEQIMALRLRQRLKIGDNKTFGCFHLISDGCDNFEINCFLKI